jgi:hypothetical protein
MRPLGVTLSAYFQFFRGVLVALLAAGIFLASGLASRVAGLAEEGNLLQRVLGGLGHFLGIALLLYAAIAVILGAGLLLRQDWARLLTIWFSGLGAILLLPRAGHGRPFSVLLALLDVAVMIYLWLPQARAYFASASGNQLSRTT